MSEIHDGALRRYQEAFVAANPSVPLPAVRYSRGWFKMGGSGVLSNYRLAEIVEMTARLEARALNAKSPPPA